ncbi:hypothetical protein ACFL67_03930 [candidate division KSB1 bacterium]
MVGNFNESLNKDIKLFVGVILVPALPLILFPGAIMDGNWLQAFFLAGLQAVFIFPWFAIARKYESIILRMAAFIASGIYWIVMFLLL